VYGGVVAGGNGNTADAANINNTMFRGIQFSNEQGILQFDTTYVTFLPLNPNLCLKLIHQQHSFPGHYTGRTTHIHVLAHINSTLNALNSTLTGGHISHVGQLFFDQSLITAAESVSPYTTNTQPLLLNADDGIFAQEAATSDPVLNYVFLGDKVEEGVFAWVTVGVDPSAVTTPKAAVEFGEGGGVANPDAGGPGGPGGPPPGGPRPSGGVNSTAV
jgi:hypothetical protein